MTIRKYIARRVVAIVGIAFWLMLANVSWAAGNQQYQLVNGLAVYIGVLPAAMTTRYLPGRSPSEVHGGAPSWGEQFHVIVAIFDNTSGTRVTDAEVSAAVVNASVPGERVSGPPGKLQPMQLADGTAYGNYFNMPGPIPYRIEVEIRRRGIREAAKATFDYKHAVVNAKPPS